MNALEWLSQGVAVFPCKQDKTPAGAWGKWRDVLPTEQMVCAWVKHYPAYGVVMGWHGLHVIDFDDASLYGKWLDSSLSDQARESYTVLTRRGVHVYLYSDRPFHTAHFNGVDVLGRGAYVLGEGSLHPSGITYVGNGAPIVRVSDLASIALGVLSLAGGKERNPPPILGQHLPTRVRPSIGGGDAWSHADNALTWEERKRRAKQVPAWEVLGLTPSPSGPGKGLTVCPLHDDEHPSLSCDLVTGRVSCLAGCTGRHGWDGVDAYQWRYGCDFNTAVMALSGG